MADAGAPQAEPEGLLLQVKGFPDICRDFLRFPFEVPDEVKCNSCQCIPRLIYPLLCQKHGLCFDCKIMCKWYYCPNCQVDTTPEKLDNIPCYVNSGVETLWVLCYFCGRVTPFPSLEEHLLNEHEAVVCGTEIKHLEATSDDINGSCKPPRVSSVAVERNLISQRNQHSLLVYQCVFCEENIAKNNRAEHIMTCQEWPVKCVSCDLVIKRKHIAEHLSYSCSKENHLIRCELCDDSYNYSQKMEHISQCPKIPKKCPDCGVTDFKVDLDFHQKMNCQKRAVRCEYCFSALCFDELQEHNKVCEEMEVACEDCKWMVLRKEMPKHVSESCPMRVIHCKACEEPYSYAEKEDHQKQCAMRTISCNYCKVELKASGDHYREEILKLQERIREMEEHKREEERSRLAMEDKIAAQQKLLQKALGKIAELEERIKDIKERNDILENKLKLRERIREVEERKGARNANAKLQKRIQALEDCQREAYQNRLDVEENFDIQKSLIQNLENQVGGLSRVSAALRRVDKLDELVEMYLGPFQHLLNGLHEIDRE